MCQRIADLPPAPELQLRRQGKQHMQFARRRHPQDVKSQEKWCRTAIYGWLISWVRSRRPCQLCLELLVDAAQDVRQQDHRVGRNPGFTTARSGRVFHAVRQLDDLVGRRTDGLVVHACE